VKEIEPAIMVITEQNMMESNKTPLKVADNLAAQVPKTFSQVGQLLTDDDDAITGRTFPVNPDTIGLMSDGTKAPNMPEATAKTVDKPKSVEPCANATKACMASYKASKVAGTRTDPESNLHCSCPRRRFVDPTDKLPMAATASNSKIQCEQPTHQDQEA
jgi:hypothetical protein